jgi:hypothetical protein
MNQNNEKETYYVRINGKANIPERLCLGHNYKLEADCSITSENKVDNENGEFDVIFKVEPITVSITRDNGTIVKAKDPRKNSTKIRNLLYFKWKELNEPIDFEDYYTRFTNTVLVNMDALITKMK